MTFQSIVPFSFNGETLYTHSSWFSEKQYNGWSSIPQENKNLAFYYSLSTLSLIGIFFRKNTLVRSVFSSYSKFFFGFGSAFVGTYIGWLGLLKSQQNSEFARLVSRNDCGSTPLWRKEDAVVNLREKDYATFMNRRNGVVYNLKDVQGYKPDCVLLGKNNSTLEKLA